jgi:hypothetical protein
MTARAETLRVPNEFRFVQALALAVPRADALDFLCAVGALRGEDLGVVERVREALDSLYDEPMPVAYSALVLINALAQPDNKAFVAYQVARLGARPRVVEEALARVGTAEEWYGRPWDDGLGELLATWREWVRRLLALAGLEVAGIPSPGRSDITRELASRVNRAPDEFIVGGMIDESMDLIHPASDIRSRVE